MRLGGLVVRVARAVLVGSALTTIAVHLFLLASVPASFGMDLRAYTEAARRLVTTGSPYADILHHGPIEHVVRNIPIAYLYPPPLAQLFVPLAITPVSVLAVIWTAVQSLLLGVVLVYLYRNRAGESRGWPLVLLAAAAFHPTLIALTIGNVSGWIAILSGVILLTGPPTRSLSAAFVAWLKVTPGALGIGALLDPVSRRSAFISGLAIFGISFAISPGAWADWIAVLPSLLRMPAAEGFNNLAVTHVLDLVGLNAFSVLAGIGVPLIFLAMTIWNALGGRHTAWVASAIGVYLTATTTSWLQYFVILVPIAVAVWPAASARLRVLIAVGWCWYGPIFLAFTTSWHQPMGLLLWLGFLGWVSVAPSQEGRFVALRQRRLSFASVHAKRQ